MALQKAARPGSRKQAHERLLIEAAQKDPEQFAGLYEEHFELVYAYIARRVRDRDAAEDLTSDVFHKALAALPRFDWRGVPFAVWLLRIAANVITDRWKRSSREITGIDDPPEPLVETVPEDIQMRAQLFRAVDQLPADQRRVVRMRFAEDKSIRDIAKELGRTEGAVKQLQFRGLQTLRAELGGK